MSAERIVAAARSWIGTPYLHQVSLKGVGCDCLGLLRGVYRDVIGEEPELPPPYSADWAEASGREAMAEAARRHLAEIAPGEFAAGDVILFRWRDGLPAKHCAIATSADAMVHAHDGAAVAEVAIGPWWRRRIAFAFRFPSVV
jgi:NlpC/P60 family putative phage cell wall peptidase